MMHAEDVHVRYKTTDMPTYYFRINDTNVRVTPSTVREREVGDINDYIQYSRGDRVIGESRAHSLLWGIVGVFAEILVIGISISCFCVRTKDSTGGKKEEQKKLPQDIDYSALSVKEFYVLKLIKL